MKHNAQITKPDRNVGTGLQLGTLSSMSQEQGDCKATIGHLGGLANHGYTVRCCLGKPRAKHIVQWQTVCLAFRRTRVQSLEMEKKNHSFYLM